MVFVQLDLKKNKQETQISSRKHFERLQFAAMQTFGC